MLSYLTHKLRTPELNGSSAFHTKTDDDHDSGTESDDESAEIEELQKYMEHSIQLEDGSGHHSPSGRRKVVLCQHATRFRQTQQTQQQTQQQDTQQQQPNNKPMERRRGQPAHHHQPVSGPAVVTALLSATVAAGVGRGPPPTSVGGAAGCVGGGGSPVLLDSALPSDSDPNLEQHSSEEELEVINNRAGSAEKRKWSQANQRRARGARASLRRSRSDGAAGDTSSDEEEYDAASVAGDAALAVNGALSNGGRSDDDGEDDDDDEDDEEVRDLTWSGGSRCEAANGAHSSSNASSCSSQRSSSSSATVVPPAPVEFRASPPLHVHRPYNGSPPPKVFHAAAPVGGGGLGPTTLTLSASAHIPAFEVCAVSPRKRHRQDRGGGTAFGVFSLVDGGPVQRPCLDFEKMQQIRVKLL